MTPDAGGAAAGPGAGGGVHVEEIPGGVRIAVRLSPGASRDRVLGVHGKALKIAIQAPPERGRANRALCAFLARKLGIRPAQVQVASGPASRDKTLEIGGLDRADCQARLARLGDAARPGRDGP